MREVLRLWPALDLRGGGVVRLLHGEAAQETRYDEDPADAARRFEAEGADGIHVVDLDAAFGTGDNSNAISRIFAATALPVQVGGGLRTRDGVRALLGEGAARVVLGSVVFRDPLLFAALARELPGRLVVALDCRDGVPRVKGWTEDSGAGDATAIASRLAPLPLAGLLVTDIARDGAMTGPNLDLLASVRGAYSGELLASGGMRGAEDLAPVDGALSGGARGVILGRAIHGGHTTVAALRAGRDALSRREPAAGGTPEALETAGSRKVRA